MLGSLEVLARALLVIDEGVRWCAAAWVGGVARTNGGGGRALALVAGIGVCGLEAPAVVAASERDSVVGTGWSGVGFRVILA